jgi:hypothetical protein
MEISGYGVERHFQQYVSYIVVEETGVPRENHRSAESHWQTLSDNVVSGTPSHDRDSNSQLYWW